MSDTTFSGAMSDADLDLVVIGLGYVGLPLAKAAVSAGLRVVGLDTSPEVITHLNEGLSHVDDLSNQDIEKMLLGGFRSTNDASVINLAQTIVICVPTPLTDSGAPDLSYVTSASHKIAENLRHGQLVILESTTYPGTTQEIVIPTLATSGLTPGRDFACAYSPERIDPGNEFFRIGNTPKVVGGFTENCLNQAVKFYAQFIDQIVPAKGLKEAEMAKLLENTYRHVNIALVNEMARFCHELDIDLWDTIRCASSKPFGFQAFYPGPGVGGHCIPIDPRYLSHRVRAGLGQSFRFVELAQDVNAGMPAYVVSRIQKLLNSINKPVQGSHILLLGVTYKADIADLRESPAIEIIRRLADLGAIISYHDPHTSYLKVAEMELKSVTDLVEEVRSVDVTVLLQSHDCYLDADLGTTSPLILDTRGVLVGQNVVRL